MSETAAKESAAWWSAWAKTDRDRTGHFTSWLPLHQHLADAAGVAEHLVDHWLSPLVVRRIALDLGGDPATVRSLAAWLAAVHDVGKLSPAFAVQVPTLADAMRRHGALAPDPRVAGNPKRSLVRHELVGQHTVYEWLIDELGFEPDLAAQFACVVGGHHGEPPTSGQLDLVDGLTEFSGGPVWTSARTDVLRWACDLVGGPEVVARLSAFTLRRPAQVLLSAIVIMADWIASDTSLFPLDPLHTADETPRPPDVDRTSARVRSAWDRLSLPPRWTPELITDPGAAFGTRFDRAPGSMRPVQAAAVEAALTQPEPGMVIVEAPMGEGKTEAALLAAEVLAARSGADGCFVALPTRATTDAMFGRVLDWMSRLPGLPGDVSVRLAHGKASLNDRFRGLLRAGFLHDIGDELDDVGLAHRWLAGRRRGPLSQFVIGTVDQVLVAGLKSRHLALRHLALAGKVVVIDEVHAYDVFMSRYLDRVLHWLGSYGTPVVLLSATLPAGRRAELLAAYDDGRGATPEDPGYPAVLATGLPSRAVPASRDPLVVGVERLPDDLDLLVELLRDALADGGCAVVVRNTVARVQEAAERLVDAFGEDRVTIAHSRFLACDRARLDADLLRRFGPPGDSTDRPVQHIVVASQVVEQSLDVDFDLMVTDLAPIDLVLQRLGRVHRHVRERPADLRRPRCVLVGVEDWTAEPIRAVTGGRRVYGEHTLLRSAALLADRDEITLPDDISPLVQAGYGGEPLGPTSWQSAMDEAAEKHLRSTAKRRENAAEFLLGDAGGTTSTLEGWVRAGVGDADPDGRDPRRSGQVRDGAESIEVLVVQRDEHDGLLTPDWIEHSPAVQLPLFDEVPPHLARIVAACALRLPPAMSQLNPVGDGVIAALEQNRYASFDASPLLSGQLVLVLDDERRAEIRHGAAAFRLTYDVRRGLLHEALDR